MAVVAIPFISLFSLFASNRVAAQEITDPAPIVLEADGQAGIEEDINGFLKRYMRPYVYDSEGRVKYDPPDMNSLLAKNGKAESIRAIIKMIDEEENVNRRQGLIEL